MSKRAGDVHTTALWHEIHEQPTAIQHALDSSVTEIERITEEVCQREIDLIVLVARGTSDHAALYAQYVFQAVNGIPVALATPSIVTLYGATLRWQRALVIGISQSGAAPDVAAVLQQARQAGALTVGITNVAGSLLVEAATYVLLCAAGPEVSVAATKTYTTTCALLAQLAAYLPGGAHLREPLRGVPALVTEALRSEDEIARVVPRYVHARDCVVLGRAFQYSTARETALKLAETCYLGAMPFSSADFRHGPAALIEPGRPVILYAPAGRTLADHADLLRLLHAQAADTLVISDDPHVLSLATTPLPMHLPDLPTFPLEHEASQTLPLAELLLPIPSIIYGQFLALHLAVSKGLNPDQPRGLSKVTRTL